MNIPRVILMGGAPLSGKTVVAHKLAARLGCVCISTDDLGMAAAAMTTPESHPGLHIMAGQGYADYYLSRSDNELAADALRQLNATWPAVAAVIRAHATWSRPAVIEGWALLPEEIAGLQLAATAPVYLVSDETTLRQRLEADEEFLRAASDRRGLVDRFCQRSAWYNRMIAESARRLGLLVVKSLSTTSVDEVTEACLRATQSG